MIEIISVPILLKEGANFVYFLLLLQKLEYHIERLFKLKLKFKLLKNSVKIKTHFSINMFNFRDYIFRFSICRKLKANEAKLKSDEKRNKIRDDEENKHELKKEKKRDEKAQKLGLYRCQNDKCKSYLSAENLLMEIKKNAIEKMKEQPSLYNEEDLKLFDNLMCHCEDIESLNLYKDILKSVEVKCKGCSHEVEMLFNPSFIMELQRKAKAIKIVS